MEIRSSILACSLESAILSQPVSSKNILLSKDLGMLTCFEYRLKKSLRIDLVENIGRNVFILLIFKAFCKVRSYESTFQIKFSVPTEPP